MPKTRLISPGSIPNHKLLKNLQLRDSYISNDGGDEGIRITDAGLVGIGVTDPDSGLEVMNTGNLLKLSYDDDDYLLFEGQAGGDTTAQSTGGISFQVDTNQYFGIREGAPGSSGVSRYSFGTSDPTEFKINAASDINDNCTYSVAEYGATTITSTNNRVEHILYAPHLILKPEKVGSVIINKDVTGTLTSTYTALQIDYDHTGISASGQTMAGIGLDLDMNCESVTHVGTVNQTGIDLDIVAATDGTQRNVCIDVKCSGGDEATGLTIDTDGGTQSTGIYIDNKNGTTDFKNVSSADATDYFTINTIAAGATTLATVDTTVGATAHLTLNIDGDINLKPNGNDVFFNDVADTGENIFRFNVANSYMNIHDDSDVANYFQIAVANEGATTISTVDDGSAVGHLTLDPDGDLLISGCDVKMDATKKLYLDGGGDTYIHERNTDNVEIIVGGDTMLIFQEHGADGNAVAFPDNTSAGFTRQTGSFDATNSTVDFRLGNKAYLAVTGAITNLKLTFPEGSGNFVLYLDYDGDHTITNYLAYYFDESAATVDNVMWPGGTKPDNTASGNDIFSFYWDATAQTVFGVASLAFAEP